MSVGLYFQKKIFSGSKELFIVLTQLPQKHIQTIANGLTGDAKTFSDLDNRQAFLCVVEQNSVTTRNDGAGVTINADAQELIDYIVLNAEL
mgnify:CR=1 FL=1